MPTDQRPRSKKEAARQRIAARRAAEAAALAAARRRQRTVVGSVVAAVVLAVVLVTVIVVQTQRTSTSANAPVPPNTADGGDAVVVGSVDAPVTVDLYEDFQCPNCKAFQDATGTTLAQLVAAGTVQVHHHGMAFLDTDGNDRYSTRALNAAGVVVGAAGADAFEAFSDALFAHQPDEGGSGLDDDQLIAYAAQAGASGPTVEEQIRDLHYGDWVAQVTEQASKDGVTGTPTVLVDGAKLTDLSAAGLTAAVTAAQP